MKHVEQAVFTSAETDRSAGYQVVARSPGVCDEDAREIAVWGPSHDSLLDVDPGAVSFNFHPLPSGSYCVSRTMAAGWEYSGRGGHRVYTQCLIVPSDVLRQFANNPLSLIRAALATGALTVHDRVPRQLETLRLAGVASPVDQTLLARLAAHPGPRAMAALVQAALDSPCLAISSASPAVDVIAGLMSCLPPECRTECSFCTGLKYSSRRPFRLVALSGDPAQQRWVGHYPNVTVLDLAERDPRDSMLLDGWARLIERVLVTGRTSFLASQLTRRRFDLSAEDLSALGLQLLEELDTSTRLGGAAFPSDATETLSQDETPPQEIDDCPKEPRSDDGCASAEILRTRAHSAHSRFHGNGQAAGTKQKPAPPSKAIASHSPEVLDKLERLDDVVFEAIDGRESALASLESLWPEVLGELGEEQVAESREQYLRYALTIWENATANDGTRSTHQATRALDVLCLLYGDGF